MIELTAQQMQAMENPEVTPPRVVNPRTKETFVLLRVEEYERLKEGDYYAGSKVHQLASSAGAAYRAQGWRK